MRRGRADKYGVTQGVVDTFLYIGAFSVVRMRPEYGDEEIEVPLAEVPYLLRLTHAMCYYTMQARTVKNRHMVLLDTDSKHFSVRALIVGLSRVEEGSFLHIGDSTSLGLFVGERKVRQIDRRGD